MSTLCNVLNSALVSIMNIIPFEMLTPFSQIVSAVNLKLDNAVLLFLSVLPVRADVTTLTYAGCGGMCGNFLTACTSKTKKCGSREKLSKVDRSED